MTGKNPEEIYHELLKSRRREMKRYFAHKPLISEAFDCVQKWSDRDTWTNVNPTGRYGYVAYADWALLLQLHLGPDDSLAKDVMIFIDEFVEPLADKFGLTIHRTSEDESFGNRQWEWERPDYSVKLAVRAWYGNSNKCKRVPTGEKRDVMKVVCE